LARFWKLSVSKGVQMVEKQEFMAEITKIFLEWLRKQASAVLLLSLGIVAMWQVGTSQLTKQEQKISQQELRIEAMSVEIRKCDAERAALQVEVSNLRFQLELAFPKLRLRGK
jgi:cell division protein FtsL